jgi:class 3 adenylate cyclase
MTDIEAGRANREVDRDRRKLVAVMYADMVGYSRLIGLDDQGTLNRLRALRRDLMDPGGRIRRQNCPNRR